MITQKISLTLKWTGRVILMTSGDDSSKEWLNTNLKYIRPFLSTYTAEAEMVANARWKFASTLKTELAHAFKGVSFTLAWSE